MEHQPISGATPYTEPNEQQLLTDDGDKIWDMLFSLPESDAFILRLEAELEDDILHGRVEEGGFGDAD
jgi:hypothetical protein